MTTRGMGIGSVVAIVACGLGLLAACNDADDRPVSRAGGEAGAGGYAGAEFGAGAGGEASEPLTFEVHGSVCGKELSYAAPANAVLTVILSPDGLVNGLVIGDGPLTNINDVEAMKAYGELHDVIAAIGLENPVALGSGSLGWASGAVRARGLGSLKLSGTDQRPSEISEYEPGKRIAGTVTHELGWFSDSYPGREEISCTEGTVTLSFRGGYKTWDGQADCYSPTQNLDRIANGFAAGCQCDPDTDKAVCVSICDDPSEASGEGAACDGVAVALFCIGDQWQWGYDGPCH